VGWVWTAIQEGGPWAAFLLLLGLVVWARLPDRWVTEKSVDRSIAAYVEINKNQATELAFYRAAADAKDKTIMSLSEQNAKLTVSSQVSAYALDQIVKGAPGRVVDPQA
jgi:hypothetical protein